MERDPSAPKLDGGVTVSMGRLLAVFLKIGSIGFGGGMAVIALMEQEFVRKRRLIPLDEFVHSVGLGLGWLKPQEFLDGVAISTLTPGPIAVLATFAGFHLAGTTGALAAMLALFAPGIMLMLAISPQYGRFRDDHRAQRFLAGVNPAVAGLILSAALLLGRSALISRHGYALLALSFSLLARLRWHPASVLSIGAAAGYFGLLP